MTPERVKGPTPMGNGGKELGLSVDQARLVGGVLTEGLRHAEYSIAGVKIGPGVLLRRGGWVLAQGVTTALQNALNPGKDATPPVLITSMADAPLFRGASITGQTIIAHKPGFDPARQENTARVNLSTRKFLTDGI